MKKFLLLMVAIVFGNVAMAQRIYDRVDYYYEGLAKVAGYTSTNGWSLKYGFVNEYNQLVIPLKYEDAGHFVDGVAWVSMGEKCGYINKKGVVITPIIYDYVHELEYGFGLVKLNGKKGCINKTGKLILSCKFKDIGIVLVKNDAGEEVSTNVLCADDIYYNANGVNITPAGYKASNWGGSAYYGGANKFLLLIQKDDLRGTIDVNGKIIIPAKYDKINEFYVGGANNYTEGLLKVKKGDVYGLLDYSGKVVIPVEYEEINYLKESKNLSVQKNGMVGIIDINGNEVVPVDKKRQFDCWDYSIVTDSQGKWGAIDPKTLEIKVECIYDTMEMITQDNDNYLIIKKDDKIGIAYGFHREIRLLYDDIQFKEDGVYFKIGDKYGYSRNLNNYSFNYQKPSIECIYDDFEIIDYSNEYYFLKKDGLWCVTKKYDGRFSTEFCSKMKPQRVACGIMLDKNGKIGIISFYNGS